MRPEAKKKMPHRGALVGTLATYRSREDDRNNTGDTGVDREGDPDRLMAPIGGIQSTGKEIPICVSAPRCGDTFLLCAICV